MEILRFMGRFSILAVMMAGLLSAIEEPRPLESIVVEIPWRDSFSLHIEEATYPEELGGLPLISVHLEDAEAQRIVIEKMETSVLSDSAAIPDIPIEVARLRKATERGISRYQIDIVPIYFDSLNKTYARIESLQIRLEKSHSKANIGNLRTSDTENSVLADGQWIKIPVTKSGIYKLDDEYLKKSGLSLSGVNPKSIKIYGYGGGMLPQKNSDFRPVDLPEVAIFVSGESDGRFDKGDFILFYGQDPHRRALLPNSHLDYQFNLYSDTSYYFVGITDGAGLRMTEKPNMSNTSPVIKEFDDIITHEKDLENIINSGREWFGEKFDLTLTYDFNLALSDLVPDSEVKVTSSVMGQSFDDSSMDIFLNGKSLGVQKINPIVDGTYLAKGSLQRDNFVMNTNDIPATGKFSLRYSFNRATTGRSKAYLNYFTLLTRRSLKPFGNQTAFRSLKSLGEALSTYGVANATEIAHIWDITNPGQPAVQQFTLSNGVATFGTVNSGLQEYIMLKDGGFLVPGKAQKVQNQNLHGLGAAELLIISHPSLLTEANRLADFRVGHDGLSVQVVSINEVYNEFSSGRQDVSAARDFIKYIYDKSSGSLANVLVFGRGSFDYKDRIDGNYNFVPIYTSRNSLHPINSYSSDDYLGFLDDDEGEWVESYSGDHLMDVGIGRLPVKTPAEARIVVDKLIRYNSDSKTYGEWRNELLFIADDGDGNLHQRDADKLATLVDTTYRQFNVNKVYVDAYPQMTTSSGESAPAANEAIARHIEDGSLIVNFTGHGSTTRWTSETILNLTSISEFENKYKLPLFVTATCEFGRHDNPMVISGAEYLLLSEIGGAIGLVTTARPVFSSTNFILNRAFYNYALKKQHGHYFTLGEIFRRTKNESLNGNVNRNFSLLGDPSMTLAYAMDDIKLFASDSYLSPGDTLNALGTVKMKGYVTDAGGAVNNAFNGTLVATVFDKPTKITTLGNEDPPMNFLHRDNVLFKGEATVTAGEFELAFIVPRDISYDFKKGKISMYALDEVTGNDAAGSNIEFVIGGESEDYEPDNTPPSIQMYINDSTFVEGGITGQDVIVLARLTDESGIGISNSPEGPGITVRIDDGEVMNASAYYKASKDTYKEGWVTFPLKNLSTGTHTATLGVRDTHNNYSEAEIDFVVVDGAGLTIKNLVNYPNPFNINTTMAFEHNHAGDDLEIGISIFSSTGVLVKQYSYVQENSPSQIEKILWDGTEENGINLMSGLYILKLSVSCRADGSKNTANHKLVIIK